MDMGAYKASKQRHWVRHSELKLRLAAEEELFLCVLVLLCSVCETSGCSRSSRNPSGT
jgi:hypothetical protein